MAMITDEEWNKVLPILQGYRDAEAALNRFLVVRGQSSASQEEKTFTEIRLKLEARIAQKAWQEVCLAHFGV